MRTKRLLILSMAGLCIMMNQAMSQVAINTNGSSPDGSAMLDIQSATRGMLIPRITTAQRDDIVSPAIGLVIFNTTTDCIEVYNLSGWWNICNSHELPAGVTATPSPNPICEGNTLTLTGNATGATLWSWTGPNGFSSSLQSPAIPGITSAGAGVYTLTASNAAGSATPVSSASVALITVIPDAAGTISGTTPVAREQNGVAYSVATASGATYYSWAYTGTGFSIVSGEGTNSITADFSPLATSGDLTVTPTNDCGSGTSSPAFSIEVLFDPNCWGTYDYSNTVEAAGYTWIDRNLGASRVATAYNDYQAYGSFYQWGRQSDGHQCIDWTSPTSGTPQNGTTLTQCSNGSCVDALFVVGTDEDDYDWNTPANNTLWNGSSKGINDPCPEGFRVPSATELITLNNSFDPQNFYGAFDSPVKMVAAGARIYNVGMISYSTSIGNYWSSTHSGNTFASNLISYNNSSYLGINYRAHGMSIRCIAQ